MNFGSFWQGSEATIATNTAAKVSLVGLASVAVFLIANAVAILRVIFNIPDYEIKTIMLKGLDEESARIYLNIEFAGTNSGKLISAQTEGPTDVSLFISAPGENLPEKPSVNMQIPSDIKFNLASSQPSNFVIDDLEIKFSETLNPNVFAKIIQAKLNERELVEEDVPNLRVKIKTRVVFKSFWIPLGASFDLPRDIDLKKILLKKKQADGSKAEDNKENKAGDNKENKAENSVENK